MVAGVVASFVPALAVSLVPHAPLHPSCGSGGCAVTIDARDFRTGNPLTHFSYIINVDNTKLPNDPTSLSTESNSPIVRGGQPEPRHGHLAGRSLPRSRSASLDHKMWGAYITLPDDATATAP